MASPAPPVGPTDAEAPPAPAQPAAAEAPPAPAAAPAPAAELPLRARVVLLIGVCVLKLSYLLAYGAALPFLHGPIFDSQVYLAQAAAVRAGRFGDATLLAFSPLYGYFLAPLAAPTAVVLAQFALGLGSLVLLYRAVRAHSGPSAALAAAALFVGYGALLFNETKVLSETLGFALALLALALFLRPAFRAGNVVAGILCGVVLGLSILARASLLFCAPFFGVALFRWGRGDVPLLPRLRRLIALGVGLGLILGGNGLWTYAHSGFFVPVIFVSSTVAKTTGKEWTGSIQDLNKQGDTEGNVGPWDVVFQAQDRLLHHNQPAAATPTPRIDILGWLRGAPRKLQTTLLDIEISSFMYSYYGERRELPVLWALPVSFGVLMLLGALGASTLARRDGLGALWPYLPFFVGPLVTCTLYHPSSRYRLAMVLPMLVLAGPGVDLLRRWLRDRRLTLAAPVLLVLAVLVYRNQAYTLQNPGMWHAMVARSAVLAGDLDTARERVRLARAQGGDSKALDRYLRNIGLPELEPR